MQPKDQKRSETLEDDPGIGRKFTREMDAEIASVLFERPMDFVAVFAVRNHPSPEKCG
jgi:hypothetical protein